MLESWNVKVISDCQSNLFKLMIRIQIMYLQLNKIFCTHIFNNKSKNALKSTQSKASANQAVKTMFLHWLYNII